MTLVPGHLKKPLVDLLLSLADDKLILGHRNSDWTGLGPMLEEDIAFSHLAQDEMAHAQALYELAGRLLERGAGAADEFAFGRRADEYRCAELVETPDEFDWAAAIARKFFCDHFDILRLSRMSRSAFAPLGELAVRLLAEERLHVEHVNAWVHRLGRGTPESRARLQKALDALAPQAAMLFEEVQGQEALESENLYPGTNVEMFEQWSITLRKIAADAGLRVEVARPGLAVQGGRRGVHSEHLKPLLDEMCEVYRLEPGAAW